MENSQSVGKRELLCRRAASPGKFREGKSCPPLQTAAGDQPVHGFLKENNFSDAN